jgi:hypothetical protein
MRCCLTASRPSSKIFASRQTGGATIPSLPARRQHRHTRSSSLANPNQLLTRLKTMFKGKSAGQARAEEVPVGQLSVLTPRQYQQDLINLGSSTNVLITLPTGTSWLGMFLNKCRGFSTMRPASGPNVGPKQRTASLNSNTHAISSCIGSCAARRCI